MERNAAMASMLDGITEAYKSGGDYFKAANARKAAKAVREHTAPIRVAQEAFALDGVGKGTVEKIAECA